VDGSIRTYQVANIKALSVESQSFERRLDFALADHCACQTKRFEAAQRPERAVISASAPGLKRLAALGSYAAQAASPAEDANLQGWSQLALPFENIEQAALTRLGIGPEVRVIAPMMLRERIECLAREIATMAAEHQTDKGGKQ
jgi:WYL domain